MLPLLLALALAEPVSPEVVEGCDAALEVGDAVELRTCVETWVLSDPKNPLTDWYGFHLAVLEGDTTAAVAARNRALARGLDPERARVLGSTELPYNPMVTVQRVFLAVILLLGGVLLVWARVRAIRATQR